MMRPWRQAVENSVVHYWSCAAISRWNRLPWHCQI